MKAITFKNVITQLKDDLIGKDSYRGVTLSYSWLANQFGHISLGFIPTFIAYQIFSKHHPAQKTAFYASLAVSVAWLLFETYNFLGPLLLNRRSISKALYIPGKKYVFTPAWGNVAFDTITDLFFFWFGAFVSGILCAYSFKMLAVIMIILLLLLVPAGYWYLTKMYLQNAIYPFQFRLSQWEGEISAEDHEKVIQFLTNKTEGIHLLVFGTERSGKTNLSVGLSTEFSIKHAPCTYTTAMKIFSKFFDDDREILDKNDSLWTWRTSQVMVIDDINPGKPVRKDIIDAQTFLMLLDNYSRSEINREIMRSKNVIWVLGEETRAPYAELWKKMLLSIGIAETNIFSINLSTNQGNI